MNEKTSRTAEIRRIARVEQSRAERMLADLLLDLFAMPASDLRINYDQYSLNSLNGFFSCDGEDFFFKFHQEEGEEDMTGEYYRADILANAGLPVDQPVHMSVLPGEQILIYRRRNDPRFSDVLRELDLTDDPEERTRAIEAERNLSTKLLAVYRETLHPISVDEAAAEPIHRLFHERLIDPATRSFPGGRFADFYMGKTFRFPGVELGWDEFSHLKFVINGRRYGSSIGELFHAAYVRLNPSRLADNGGVVAHGDAHNANVWYTAVSGGKAQLSFFDPAFAGSNVPALLAEVKATFHNIFAHPFWLYDPAIADRTFKASVRRDADELHVETDWKLAPVRRSLLEVKAKHLWRPLLGELKQRALLPDDWRMVVRLALFLCPTLVMDLRAGARSHTPASSLIAFCVAVMAGSPPEHGSDDIGRFLDMIDPES
ncbi:hypothetical protein [Phyllobacterium endophyticum]|uniref:Uncharacterized protein n=1 Tax=Phyllobacterium endophyticum TaxID=1149773 RepID=A0A2P7AQP6_9HYPH|nr:hypothetical protein [Phyllobacterium endophyticum]MBB3236975.1 hypothetical protein [Phyllobacterium endophyticum]PSH56551.1 hypothetical protein CU100_14275 [Phyllobacterium endophyticum]TYR44449.1 hypothetical protein FY050_04860 [Phyllobacterium endophyticum]